MRKKDQNQIVTVLLILALVYVFKDQIAKLLQGAGSSLGSLGGAGAPTLTSGGSRYYGDTQSGGGFGSSILHPDWLTQPYDPWADTKMYAGGSPGFYSDPTYSVKYNTGF